MFFYLSIVIIKKVFRFFLIVFHIYIKNFNCLDTVYNNIYNLLYFYAKELSQIHFRYIVILEDLVLSLSEGFENPYPVAIDVAECARNCLPPPYKYAS